MHIVFLTKRVVCCDTFASICLVVVWSRNGHNLGEVTCYENIFLALKVKFSRFGFHVLGKYSLVSLDMKSSFCGKSSLYFLYFYLEVASATSNIVPF